MKLWKKPHILYDFKEQKGWDVYCQIGETVMVHWFTSPRKEFWGCLRYLAEKGYWKVNTEKRLQTFRKLWKSTFVDID